MEMDRGAKPSVHHQMRNDQSRKRQGVKNRVANQKRMRVEHVGTVSENQQQKYGAENACQFRGDMELGKCLEDLEGRLCYERAVFF